MSFYLSINALQPPFSIGNDSSNRAMLSFNFTVEQAGNPTALLVKVASILAAAGLGTLGTDMFYGSLVTLPQSGTGPFISLIASGGLSGSQTHNGDNITRPNFQVIVRASTYNSAETRANLVYVALNGKHNITV